MESTPASSDEEGYKLDDDYYLHIRDIDIGHKCAVCGLEVTPHLQLKALEMTQEAVGREGAALSPVKASSPLQQPHQQIKRTAAKRSLDWLWVYLRDNFKHTDVYYHHTDDREAPIFYYCHTCGPRLGAKFVTRDFDPAQEVKTPQSPVNQYNTIGGGDGLNTPAARRSYVETRRPQSLHVEEDDAGAVFKKLENIDDIVDILRGGLNTYDKQQRDLSIYGPNKDSLFHHLLKILSPTYLQVVDSKPPGVSLRRHFGADQGWLPWMGARTYPKLYTILEEVKGNLKIVRGKLEAGGNYHLIVKSPLLWSMQHLTVRGIEYTMCDDDKSWYSLFFCTQRYRMVQSLLVLMALAYLFFLYALPAMMQGQQRSSKGGHQPTPAPTLQPTSHHPTSAHPTPPHNRTLPPTSHHPTPPHTLPPTPPASANCSLTSACETATHWDTLAGIIEHNYDLPTNPITTIAALSSACGAGLVKNVFTTIWEACTNSNSVIGALLADERTDLLVLVDTLQNVTNSSLSGTVKKDPSQMRRDAKKAHRKTKQQRRGLRRR
jgi:hypothetical protein